jgi:hypothetical protein
VEIGERDTAGVIHGKIPASFIWRFHMRKWFSVLLAILFLVVAFPAHAQAEVVINELQVSIWPEYDRPDQLVIYDFSLAPGTPSSAPVQLRIPADASLNAVAMKSGDSFVNIQYEEPVKEGDWQVVTIVTAEATEYRLEYYAPIQLDGNQRHFEFTWLGDYVVNTLVASVQEPPNVTSFKSTPTLPNESSSQDGFLVHSGTFGSVKAGESWSLEVDYTRSSDELSVAGQEPNQNVVNPAATTNSPIMESLSRNFAYILIAVAVLLIVVGVVWYLLSGRESGSANKRKRHQASLDNSSPEGQVYCHQCGKRSQVGDKFCRSCGVKLRKE